jgi:hypothetical protein
MPSYRKVVSSNPSINTYPLCDTLNPNPCAIINSISNLPSIDFTFRLSPNPAANTLTINIAEEMIGLNCQLTTNNWQPTISPTAFIL